MSDTVNEAQRAPESAAPEIAAPEIASPAPTRSAPTGAAAVGTLQRRALHSPGPPGAAGAVGRAAPRSAPLRPVAAPVAGRTIRRMHRGAVPGTVSDERPSGSRIQRSTAPGPAITPAAPVTRIQPASAPDVIRRDFLGTMKSAGRGIASAAKATGRGIASAAKATGEFIGDTAVAIGQAVYRSDFTDLNATQYLVSAGGLVEAINRRVEADGSVVYYKTGSVTVGDGDRPTITPYDPVIAMPPGWLPSVTHINGMMVKPNSGIGSAIKLQQELEKAGGTALLATDVPSVLYTYSAHRGFVTDLAECIWGKLYQDDDATDRQTQIMLDAVRFKERTTVSAHSRGTIKTDNAVRNAHAEIRNTFMPAALADPEVDRLAREAAELAAEMNPELGLSPGMLIPTYRRVFARQQADKLATAEMDRYIQLIYAGNAVQFPSASVNLTLVVAGSDLVTISVGKYFRMAKGTKTKMTDVAGGHGFNENYAATVAGLIVADLQQRQQQ